MAGIIISNVFFFLALVFLYLLVDELFDASIARMSIFYLAFAPYALFFFIGYTEALFLFLCILVFFCLQKAIKTRRLIYWLLAGIGGLFAALSRSQGVLLAVPFLVVFIQQYFSRQNFSTTTWRQKILAFIPIVLIPLGVGIYMLYLWHTKGDPLLFSKAEALGWGRKLTPPWISVANAIKAALLPDMLQIQNILNLASLAGAIIALMMGWRRLPLHYTIFAALLIIFPLLYPLGKADGLTALPRYMLIIFPIAIIFASYKGPRFEKVLLALTFPIFTVTILLFISHYWVA
ncbi:glycosyltransferase family 39 protein [Dictyobacter halimunensis]